MNGIYDSIFTIIEATFPNKMELINPYVIEDNNELFLKEGYGIELGSVVLSDAFARVQRQFQRNISISFTKQVIATDKKAAPRIVAEKLLFTEELQLITALKNGLPCDFCEFVGDEGIEFIGEGTVNFMRSRMNFIINYNQQVR